MKKHKIVLIFLGIFVMINASADYTYNYQTGSAYTTTNNGDTTEVNGYNYNTGASWNTTIDRNGNQSGYDSSGNYWTYDSASGNYYNSNGTSCFGKGIGRMCN